LLRIYCIPVPENTVGNVPKNTVQDFPIFTVFLIPVYIARKYDLHPGQISTWKTQFLSHADQVFEKGSSKTEDDKERDALFKKVGQLQLENDFLKKVLGK
jgi:hypothetical protein